MRSCYKALYTVTNEMSDMAEKEHGLNPIDHLRKAVSYTHKYNISRIYLDDKMNYVKNVVNLYRVIPQKDVDVAMIP
jgi:hypothetical protein